MTSAEQMLVGAMTRLVGGGVEVWQLDRLARQGAVPHARLGRYRVFSAADVEKIREVCRARGYWKTEELVST